MITAANWTAEETAWVCSSCYVCERGDECLQRGGCVRCEDDSFDHDTDPTTLCEPCPDGRTSSADGLTCVEDGLTTIKDKLDVIGALLCAIVVIIGACCGQDAAEDGLRWLWRCMCSKARGERVTDSDSEIKSSSDDDNHADGGDRDDEETGLELHVASGTDPETMGLLSGEANSRSDDNPWSSVPRLSPRLDEAAVLRRRLLAAGGASPSPPPPPGHQRKRSVDSSGEFFSPSAILTDSSTSSSGADGYHSVPATPRLQVMEDRSQEAPITTKERRVSAVWTPSPSLQRLRTV